jgi:hypothetical protein
MVTGRKKLPDFFAEDGIDPVESATGNRKPPNHNPVASSRKAASGATSNKKKAGFYLSRDVLQRFNHKFHEMKLAGVAIDNKSSLLELALVFALDDLDKGAKSRVLKRLRNQRPSAVQGQ